MPDSHPASHFGQCERIAWDLAVDVSNAAWFESVGAVLIKAATEIGHFSLATSHHSLVMDQANNHR